MKRYCRCGALLVLVGVLFFSAGPAWAAPANGNPQNGNGNGGGQQSDQDEKSLIQAAQAMRRAGTVQLNFTEIELVKFVRFMSELLQENIIIPPNIISKISIISPQPVSLRDARQIMLSILQVNGYSLQDFGTYSKLVQGGNTFATNVKRDKVGPGPGEEIVTYICPLDYIIADNVVQALQQAFGQNVIVLPVGNGRDVMLQGRSTDVNKGVEFIRKLDVPDRAQTNMTVKLKYAEPTMVANHLNGIAQTGRHLRGLLALPDQASRQVVVVAEPSIIADALKIIKELDVDSLIGDFHIIRLVNVDATETAEQISKVLAAASSMQPGQEGKFPAVVVPDITTNSLIFAATQRQFDSLEKVVRAIDVQPRQVLIRGFIAEVNVTNLDKAGMDWNLLGGQIWDNFMLGGVGQLGEGNISSQFYEMFSELSRKEELVERNGSTYSQKNTEPLALAYMTVELLKKYDAVNVLSVPRLMCTDNKESSFQVGQVIPMMKGSTSDLSNPGAVQQQMDYKDTGLTLTVTPHIRSGSLVALDIEQTTEDVMSVSTSLTPVTNKRQVKTSVTVADGETIILGGIIKETEKSLKRRVPGFSAIPLIGNLFKKNSKEKEKIDFVIFLTPQILSTPEMIREAMVEVVNGTGGIDRAGQTERAVAGEEGAKAYFPPTFSKVESETDRKFRELFERSVKSNK